MFVVCLKYCLLFVSFDVVVFVFVSRFAFLFLFAFVVSCLFLVCFLFVIGLLIVVVCVLVSLFVFDCAVSLLLLFARLSFALLCDCVLVRCCLVMFRFIRPCLLVVFVFSL